MPPMSRSRSTDALSVSRIAWYGRRQDLGRRAELAAEPVGEHLELQLADGGQDRLGVAEVGVAQHLHDALLVELGEAPAELLEPAVVERPGGGEHLGREPGDRRERRPACAVVERVAELQRRWR